MRSRLSYVSANCVLVRNTGILEQSLPSSGQPAMTSRHCNPI